MIPFVVSAGGGVTEADKMFPAPTGRNGRHYQRQHLSGVLVTFRQQLAAEFASRNCSCDSLVGAHAHDPTAVEP